MQFLIAILLIVGSRILFEYLDIRYRKTVLQSDYVKACYLSKNFRVKNKYTIATIKRFEHFYELFVCFPKFFISLLHPHE